LVAVTIAGQPLADLTCVFQIGDLTLSILSCR